MKDIIITINSPGEVSGWLRPVVREINLRREAGTFDGRVIVIVLPCRYASGQEVEVCRALQGVDYVLTPAEYWTLFLKRRWPEYFVPTHRQVVLFLGGDPFLAAGLRNAVYQAMRTAHLGYPLPASSVKVVGYFDNRPSFVRKFDAILDRKSDGNLFLESVDCNDLPSEFYDQHQLDPAKPRIVFFGGSRPAMLMEMIRFYAKVIDLLATRLVDTEFVINLAPFIDTATADKIEILVDTRIVRVIRAESQQLLKTATLLVTLPGTNTMESATLGVPTLVLTPYNRPDLIQFDGLLGMLGNLQGVGLLIKKLALWITDHRSRFYALPNMWAGEELTPEMRGILNPKTVAEKILTLYQNSDLRNQIGLRLREFNKPSRVAQKIVDYCLQ